MIPRCAHSGWEIRLSCGSTYEGKSDQGDDDPGTRSERISVFVGLLVGSQRINFSTLLSDPFSRTLFFRLRLPRVLMGLTIGASLALAGASLQALFRNPLADPY